MSLVFRWSRALFSSQYNCGLVGRPPSGQTRYPWLLQAPNISTRGGAAPVQVQMRYNGRTALPCALISSLSTNCRNYGYISLISLAEIAKFVSFARFILAHFSRPEVTSLLPIQFFRPDLAIRRDAGPSRRRLHFPGFGLHDIGQRGE